jgi:hypothetical protein
MAPTAMKKTAIDPTIGHWLGLTVSNRQVSSQNQPPLITKPKVP